MSQLARRENAPHRAAFVTSLSRWYIRRLLGNLPPFHPCLSAESEAPFCPLRNIVTLRAYSLEIKVRQAISVFLSVYPELVALIGASVPDYRGLFLRGHGSQTSTHYGTVTHSSADLGQLQGDAIREIKGNAIMLGGTGNDLFSGVLSTSSFDPDIAWMSPSGNTRAQFRNFEFQASKNTPSAQEIRPVNRAVRYLIRAK